VVVGCDIVLCIYFIHLVLFLILGVQYSTTHFPVSPSFFFLPTHLYLSMYLLYVCVWCVFCLVFIATIGGEGVRGEGYFLFHGVCSAGCHTLLVLYFPYS